MDISEICNFEQIFLVIFMNVEHTYDLIVALLKEKRISANKMLTDLDFNVSLITDMHRKGAKPSADKLSEIANYLKVPLEYLLGTTDKKSPAAENNSDEAEQEEIFSLYNQLDDFDKGEINGRIKQMLTAEKYVREKNVDSAG